MINYMNLSNALSVYWTMSFLLSQCVAYDYSTQATPQHGLFAGRYCIQIDISFYNSTWYLYLLISWFDILAKRVFPTIPKWSKMNISKHAELHAVDPPKAMMGMWRRIIRWHHHVDVTVPLATLAKGWEAWIRWIWMRLMGLLITVPGP